jgi:mRNA-degrading endonuclease RelE of RelBE toxin-antitoxin system
VTEVVWVRRALSDLSRIDPVTAGRIEHAVQCAADNREGDLQKLRDDPEDRWRLRVGDYRVILALDRDRVVVYRVLPRHSAYR